MQFNVDRDLFSDAVSFAVKLLPQRPTQPLLSGILIKTNGPEVEFATFDYETSAKTSIAAEITESGIALVSGRLLAEIASKLPPADVTVQLEEDRVIVLCGSANFSLPSMPVEEYPEIPEISSFSGSVKASSFTDAISQVAMAASKDDVTPVITGVEFEVVESSLALTATDRYRVSTRSVPWQPSDQSEQLKALVPARIVTEVGKTFHDTEEIKISFIKEDDREVIAFSDSQKTVTSLLIKGNYPPVQRLFPDTVPNYAVVNTQDIIEAVGRVGLVLEREAAIRFNFSEGQVILEGAGPESARASETAEAHLVGNDMVVSLKPQFLLDGLRATHSEYARIGFTNSENPSKPGPVLITGQRSREDLHEEDFKYLLQPNLLLR